MENSKQAIAIAIAVPQNDHFNPSVESMEALLSSREFTAVLLNTKGKQ